MTSLDPNINRVADSDLRFGHGVDPGQGTPFGVLLKSFSWRSVAPGN
jgi:hypothetical protein